MNAMFLKIGDKDNPIKGESVDKSGKNMLGKAGHADWIELLGFKEKVVQPASPLVGSTVGRTIERTQFSDFEVTKYVDLATPLIHQHCCAGSHLDVVIVECWRADGYGESNEPVLYLAYTMKDCMISSHEVTAAAGDLPVERVTFKYSSIATRYIPQAETAGAYSASPVGGGWDLVKNEAAAG